MKTETKFLLPTLKHVALEDFKSSVAKFDGIKTTKELFGDIELDVVGLGSALPSKSWTWELLSSGNCACDNGKLQIYPDGNANFNCRLNSSSREALL